MKKLLFIFALSLALSAKAGECCCNDSVQQRGYHVVEGLTVQFQVPDSVTTTVDVRPDGLAWINLAYTDYGNATLYITATPVVDAEDLDRVLDNRLERMSLNSGGRPSERMMFTNDYGFKSLILVTAEGTMTPVQFISYDPSWVISGAFFIDDMNFSPTVVDEAINLVKEDMVFALENLKNV